MKLLRKTIHQILSESYQPDYRYLYHGTTEDAAQGDADAGTAPGEETPGGETQGADAGPPEAQETQQEDAATGTEGQPDAAQGADAEKMRRFGRVSRQSE